MVFLVDFRGREAQDWLRIKQKVDVSTLETPLERALDHPEELLPLQAEALQEPRALHEGRRILHLPRQAPLGLIIRHYRPYNKAYMAYKAF